MGDTTVPHWQHGATGRDAVPAMPVILPSERTVGLVYSLASGLNTTIGWHFRRQIDGGPAFVLLHRRNALGTHKVVERFPLTASGWASAWHALERHNPAAIPRVLEVLEGRERDHGWQSHARELDTRTLVSLPEVAYLGGYVTAPGIYAGEQYDARFLDDRLVMVSCRQAEALAEVPYAEIEDVEIGGPGLVRTGGGFMGGGFGVKGAVEGMAIASVLNALTTRTSLKTVIRVQGTGCELFLLHTRLTPEQLRIELSRPLAAIRSARSSRGGGGPGQESPGAAATSAVEELSKLAGMLESGLLTREEFELLKASLLGHLG